MVTAFSRRISSLLMNFCSRATTLKRSLLLVTATTGSLALLVHGFAPSTTTHCSAARRPPAPACYSTTSSRLAAGKFNPFTNMLGDMVGAVIPSSSATSNPVLDSKLTETVSGWTNIRSTLSSLQTSDEERNFRENLEKGYGPPSPLHKVRLYEETNKEEDIRVTFYRDSASWCPYCQKVWTMLEHKKIPYRVEKINMRCYGEKPASFTRIQPGGQIPVAVIDGRTYGQSNDIMYALEELFPESKSTRPPKGQEARAQELLRLERQIFSAWMYWLTGGGQQSKRDFLKVLGEVEKALKQSKGPFFMGKEATLVDFMFCPFLERMAASLLYFKGFQMRVPPNTPTDYPNVNAWFDAMETLEAYQLTKSDYYTHCWDLPPQLGGCTYESGCEPYEKAINGERSLDGTQGSWELPLQPHNGGIEPDWPWAGDDAVACREAVERVSGNYEAIVNFAARGAGRKGMPPYSAPLADPNAVSNEAVKPGVDAALQVLCMALLEGVDKHESKMTEIAGLVAKEGGKEYAEGVVASLAYLRDRVGVPRDMRLPAARQLRAHLNWAIGHILHAQDR